jgi:hypothetical protein
MRKILLVVLSIIILGNTSSFAQSSGFDKEERDELIFVIKQKFPVNIVHKYYLHDSTNVHRIFADSSEHKYSYEQVFNFNEKAPGREDQDGFLDIRLSIDSLEYKFIDSTTEKVTEYNTNWDDGVPPFNSTHFLQSMVLNGKEVNMTYSGYKEVVNLSGKRYEDMLWKYNESDNKITDTLQRFIHIEGVDLDNMAFIGDVSKDLLPPNGRIEKDSSWKAVIRNRVNGIHIIDTVELKLKTYTSKLYKIEGKSLGMNLVNKRVMPYGVDMLLTPQSIEGTGTYEISITPRGTIEELKTDYDVYITVPVKHQYYVEHINSSLKWHLLKRFRY